MKKSTLSSPSLLQNSHLNVEFAVKLEIRYLGLNIAGISSQIKLNKRP
jgi:hypothetical protein